MRIEYLNLNTNKLHNELITSGVTPLLVENKDNTTWITFEDNENLDLVQQIIDAHDPTPLPQPPTEIELLRLENAQANATLQETIDVIFGGAL